MISQVNSAVTRISVDVPTGLNADTGERMSNCVEADYTVTLGLPFPGLESSAGEVWVADISIPDEVYERFGLELDGYFTESSLRKPE
jgi:NAD(P)H-hydrate epimerase